MNVASVVEEGREGAGGMLVVDSSRNEFLCSLCRKRNPAKAVMGENQIGGIDESTGELVCRSCLELTIQAGRAR